MSLLRLMIGVVGGGTINMKSLDMVLSSEGASSINIGHGKIPDIRKVVFVGGFCF